MTIVLRKIANWSTTLIFVTALPVLSEITGGHSLLANSPSGVRCSGGEISANPAVLYPADGTTRTVRITFLEERPQNRSSRLFILIDSANYVCESPPGAAFSGVPAVGKIATGPGPGISLTIDLLASPCPGGGYYNVNVTCGDSLGSATTYLSIAVRSKP